MNTFESLMKSADQALYRAKGLGRDRAELAMGDSEIDAPPSPI
jgi:PleD family two-component response regulator